MGVPGWDAPWVLPAAVAVLAAVVLAITGCLILRHVRGEASSEEIYDLCAGCWDDSEHCDGAVGSCCCTCGFDEDWGEEHEVSLLPPERSPEELGFRTERFATDTDVRGIRDRFWDDITQEQADAFRAGLPAVASHYPGLACTPTRRRCPASCPTSPRRAGAGTGPAATSPPT
jgi:hypothetical protein